MARILLLLPLFACARGLEDPTFPTGSQTLVPSAEHDAVYVVDGDGGRLVRHAPGSGESVSVEVGGEPTRVARVGDRLLVTLRAERAVAVVEDRGGTLAVVDRIEVGAEPYGLVAREDGASVYVALSQEDRVVELDGATLAVARAFDVAGQPSWLGLHPSGRALYVGSAVGGEIHWIDLDDGAVTPLAVALPTGAGPDGTGRFTRRVTGDLGVAPDGASLAVPALFVDNGTPVADPGEGAIPSDGYGSVGLGVSRFNPAVVVVPTDEQGAPEAGEAASVLVAGTTELPSGQVANVRSYLASATYSPDGTQIFATMEASSTVVALSATPLYPEAGDLPASAPMTDTGAVFISADAAGFASSPMVFVGTGAGPRGVTFLGEEQAYVHAFLDRAVGGLLPGRVTESLERQFADGFLSQETLIGRDPVEIVARALDPDAEAGRRLFYSATAAQMASDGAGVSCSTCHLDGRNDGLTWTFEHGVRQTPSLAGGASVTAPFTWTDQVASVGDEAQITSAGRMGGEGLSADERRQIEAFVETIRAVDVPERGASGAAALRGKALFERADVGCASCHSGARFTDNAHYPMYGLEAVNTPTLVGIAATAPYLHDGSAATLEEVLAYSRTGAMGDTSTLTDAELADLAAYLRSL